MLNSDRHLWVFGYGSLLWKPGFSYASAVHGYVEGWQRRFWQGNDHHRGTKTKLGRVATLVPCKNEVTWGVAYELIGSTQITAALEHLGIRECKIGGYKIEHVPFVTTEKEKRATTVQCLVFIATEESSLWLGPCSIQDEANAVIQAKGHCGTNVEYVLLIAQYMREQMPDSQDVYLYSLERCICMELKSKVWDYFPSNTQYRNNLLSLLSNES